MNISESILNLFTVSPDILSVICPMCSQPIVMNDASFYFSPGRPPSNSAGSLSFSLVFLEHIEQGPSLKPPPCCLRATAFQAEASIPEVEATPSVGPGTFAHASLSGLFVKRSP